MTPLWEASAAHMLRMVDRFTESLIRRELNALAGSRLIERSSECGPANRGYLTSVVNSSYSVIWYLTDRAAMIRAVVPTTYLAKGTASSSAFSRSCASTPMIGSVCRNWRFGGRRGWTVYSGAGRDGAGSRRRVIHSLSALTVSVCRFAAASRSA